MKKRMLTAIVAAALSIGLLAPAASAGPSDRACWGQATRVFAQTGVMGEHSSTFATPRLGLRNLARDLADKGDIPDDSMQSLGAFVSNALGLSIDACI